MKKRTYKDRALQAMYDECRRLGADTTSEMYLNGRPQRGAHPRMAYWDGRTPGLPHLLDRKYQRGSRGHAAYMAGRDDLRDFGPVEGSEYQGTQVLDRRRVA